MKRSFSILLAMGFLCLFTSTAGAGVILGVKGGVGISIQDFSSDLGGLGMEVSTSVAPTFGGNIGYAVGEQVVLGLVFEFQQTGLDIETSGGEVDFGDTQAVSILPFIEWHFIGRSRGISPYVSLAVGLNINSFDPSEEAEEEVVSELGERFDVEGTNTVGIKACLGTDFFVSHRLAVNLEFGWKLNEGEAQETLNGVEIFEWDFNASSLTFSGGLRYYF